MLANPFVPATKEQSRLRLAFIGAPGSGKTWQAMETATRLAELRGGKIAVIDTEGRSARKYADFFEFDVFDMSGSYAPKEYINAVKAAVEHGYAVIVIDSLSHAWSGSGGVLEIADKASVAGKGGNSFGGWSEGKPAQNAFINYLINADIDIIATMRAEVEWVIEINEKTGKKNPVAIGTKAVQGKGVEHEFDLALMVDMQHELTVRKTRVKAFPTGEIIPDTSVLAEGLYTWLTAGTILTVSRYLQTPEGKAALRDLLKELNITDNAPYLKALNVRERYGEYPGTFKDMAVIIRETHAALNAPAVIEDEPVTEVDIQTGIIVIDPDVKVTFADEPVTDVDPVAEASAAIPVDQAAATLGSGGERRITAPDNLLTSTKSNEELDREAREIMAGMGKPATGSNSAFNRGLTAYEQQQAQARIDADNAALDLQMERAIDFGD